ncbi:MAG: SpoIIE family protein phosphatase [Victivallales bacterium]|nr:SpoIIE family protein phosphatase [Victivallales bacterium]
MKLKHKFMISYVAVISGIVIIATGIVNHEVRDLSEASTDIACEGLEDIVRDNHKLSRQILTMVGKSRVRVQTRAVAAELRILLRSLPDLSDITAVKGNPEIRKVATEDILIEIDGHEERAGYFDLISDDGLAIIHPNPEVEGCNYSIWKDEYPQMWELVERSFTEDEVSGDYTFINSEGLAVDKFLVLNRIPGTPFIVCGNVEKKLFFERAHAAISAKGDEKKSEVEKAMRVALAESMRDFRWHCTVTGTALVLAGVLLAFWQASSLTRPIQDLCSNVRKIGQGDFSGHITEHGPCEISELAASFNSLGRELDKYIENLRRETAVRQAMESEMEITRRIQNSLLPSDLTEEQRGKLLELQAKIISAKEVSGDFFDFFFINHKTLALIIADVSGKSLPAAMFMAVTRTLLRILCLETGQSTPSDILRAANDYLCKDNDSCMFVTTFLAFYDTHSGRMTFANAGHNDVISLKDGKIERFGILGGIALGVLPGAKYKEDSHVVNPSETLLLYTDGATEAQNTQEEQFGITRIESILAKFDSQTPLGQIIDSINKELLDFQENSQFDDITLMALRRMQVIRGR